MESDIRFYRRRASEELAAANRAVTASARDRRLQLAGVFLQRLHSLEELPQDDQLRSLAIQAVDGGSAFDWVDQG